MKKTLYIICFVVLILGLTAAYSVSYRSLVERRSESGGETQAEEQMEEVPAVLTPAAIVQEDMYYVEEQVHLPAGTTSENREAIPAEWVGLSRTELEEQLQQYVDHPSIKEEAAGLCSYEIIAFTADSLVVRKTYRRAQEPTKEYYLRLSEDKLQVYGQDRATLLFDTGISGADLLPEDRDALEQGLYLDSIWDVYHFLESCTS